MAELIKDPSDIQRVAEEIRQDMWASAEKEWEIDDAFFRGQIEQEIKVPEWAERLTYIPSTAYSKVTNAVSQLITSEPVATYFPVGSGIEAEGLANKLSLWGSNVMPMFTRHSTLPPMKEFGKHLFQYGYAALYGPTWDSKAWPDFPDRGSRRRNNKEWLKEKAEWERKVSVLFPWKVQVPHPSEVLIDPSAPVIPPWGIYETQRWAQHLLDNFPDGVENPDRAKGEVAPWHHKLEDLKRTALVKVWTYWSEGKYIMAAGDNADIIIAERDNPYGFVPFLHAFAGFGSAPSRGNIQQTVSDMAWGILRPVRSGLLGQAQLDTGVSAMIWRWAFQHLVVTRDAERIGEEWSHYLVIEKGEDNELEWEEPPNVPAWIMAAKETLRQDVAEGTYSQVVRGGKDPGVRTATMHSQQVSLAKQIFNTPVQRLNHIASLFLGNCARLMDVMEAPVTVLGEIEGKMRQLTVKPQDFKGHFHFEVDMEAADEVQRSIDLERGMALRNMTGPDGTPGAYPYKRFMSKFAHEPNVEQLEKELEREKAVARMKQTPEWSQMVMQRALQIAGLQPPAQEEAEVGPG